VQGYSILTYIKTQIRNPHCQDLTLKVHSQSFFCHSVVLAAACPLVRDILSGQEGEEDKLIILEGYYQQDVEQFLAAVYGLVKFSTSSIPILIADLNYFSGQKPVMLELSVAMDPNMEMVEEEKWKGWEMDSDENGVESEKGFESENGVSEEIPIGNDSDQDYSPWSPESKMKANTGLRKRKRKLISKSGKSRFKCPFCEANLTQLPRHVAKLHPEHWEKFCEDRTGQHRGRVREWPKKCELCDKVKSSKWHYEKHLRLHLKEKYNNNNSTDVCDICGESFPSMKLLGSHVKAHGKDVSCSVPECGRRFMDINHLNEHLLFEHQIIVKNQKARGDGRYMCTVCGNALCSQGALNYHLKTVHSDPSDCISYACEICGKIFKTEPHLKRHVGTHNPPTVRCPICGKMFNHQANVVRHVKTIHVPDDQKKYQCEICCKGFIAKDSLEGHTNWHNNLKPYKCELCPNSYQNQSNLLAHQKKKHVGENEGEIECFVKTEFVTEYHES